MRISSTVLTAAFAIVFVGGLTLPQKASYGAASGQLCDGSIDCPTGYRCKVSKPGKLGRCVRATAKKAKARRNYWACDGSIDCPKTQHCEFTWPKGYGVCVPD